VLGDGSQLEDRAHVSVASPVDTKRKEIQNAPRNRTKSKSGLISKREAAVIPIVHKLNFAEMNSLCPSNDSVSSFCIRGEEV